MATKIPAFTTTCAYTTAMSGGYWYIYLKSGGSINFSHTKRKAEIFLCGGGGGGGGGQNGQGGGGGGGGGNLRTVTGVNIAAGTDYTISVGDGGYAGGAYAGKGGTGGSSSAFGYTVTGGVGGNWPSQCDGGTGYADGGHGGWGNGNEGGEKGGNGALAFGTGSVKYGAGGGGGNGLAGGETGGGDGGGWATAGSTGTANTGGGGGGGGVQDSDPYGQPGGRGGSGIVIIRGTEDDMLPVYFNGTQLKEIYLNSELLEGLIYGGTRIFARVKSWLWPKAAMRLRLVQG